MAVSVANGHLLHNFSGFKPGKTKSFLGDAFWVLYRLYFVSRLLISAGFVFFYLTLHAQQYPIVISSFAKHAWHVLQRFLTFC